jgi:siroheme synthase-like protein
MTAELPVYPASLVLEGRSVLVVGGGHVAARKVEALLAAGARVTVVAPVVEPRIAAAAGVRVERRRYRPGEAARYRLAVAATGDPQVDHLVFEDGERAGVFVNAADDRTSCSFLMPSVLRRGPVTVAVSTGGTSPALAAWIRSRIAEVIGPEYGRVARALAAARDEVQANGVPTEELDWGALIKALLAAPAEGEAAVVADWLLSALGTRWEARSGA